MLQMVQRDMSRDILSGIAIIGFILVMAVHVPIIRSVSPLIVPLPVLFYRTKTGRPGGLMILAMAVGILSVMLGRFSLDMLFFVLLLVLGFVMGELFHWSVSIERTIVYACGMVLSAAAIGLLLHVNLAHTTVMDLVSTYVAEQVAAVQAIMNNMGISGETMALMSGTLEKYLLRIIPAQIITLFLYVSWACLLLAKPLLKKWRLFYPDFGNLSLWKAPDYLVWGLIISGLMTLLTGDPLHTIGLNCLIVILTIYFFQGIAIVSFFFNKKGVPRMVRVFLYALIALQPLVRVIVMGIGLFDLWLNFRKLGPPPVPRTNDPQ